MSKFILTIICIIALNNFMVVTPTTAKPGNSFMRRTCIYNYNAGTDTISIRWADYGTFKNDNTAFYEEADDPSKEVKTCFMANKNNWWYAITQDSRKLATKFYDDKPNPNVRYIDRSYWQVNTQLAAASNEAKIENGGDRNFALPLAGTAQAQRPGAYNQVDREINNYFLSFFPNFPSMKHRLSYVVSGISEDTEGGAVTMKCGDGADNPLDSVLFPHFKANLKLYGSKESAKAAYDVFGVGNTASRNLYYDHVNSEFFPKVTATYWDTALCVNVVSGNNYVSAHVGIWWNGQFATGKAAAVKSAGKTGGSNNCAGASTETAFLCKTTPGVWNRP